MAAVLERSFDAADLKRALTDSRMVMDRSLTTADGQRHHGPRIHRPPMPKGSSVFEKVLDEFQLERAGPSIKVTGPADARNHLAVTPNKGHRSRSNSIKLSRPNSAVKRHTSPVASHQGHVKVREVSHGASGGRGGSPAALARRQSSPTGGRLGNRQSSPGGSQAQHHHTSPSRPDSQSKSQHVSPAGSRRGSFSRRASVASSDAVHMPTQSASENQSVSPAGSRRSSFSRTPHAASLDAVKVPSQPGSRRSSFSRPSGVASPVPSRPGTSPPFVAIVTEDMSDSAMDTEECSSTTDRPTSSTGLTVTPASPGGANLLTVQ